MSLDTYTKKRSFKRTLEPTGGKSKNEVLTFVVQKHQASHLHYDFRLEMKGVLKSWAVPKGPSMNPLERRLAQVVEDHPFDYKDFEGIIPDGNYGAGTVIIWDEGTYKPEESTGNKEEDEKLLIKQFYSGKISIVLNGKKLKGAFTLIKTPARGDNAWLLSKLDDQYATERNIADKNASVVSGLTIEEMTENPSAAQWQSNRSSSKRNNSKRNASKKSDSDVVAEHSKKIKHNRSVQPNDHDSKTYKKSSSSTKKKIEKSFDQLKVWKRMHEGQEIQQTESIEVEGQEIVLINYEQEYWQGITRLHLILYYQSISAYILPYLQNRPLGLNVVNKWAGEKEAKFMRNMKGNYPAWIETFTTDRRIAAKGKSEQIDWVVCNNLATLIYMLNLGAVDLHPWSANIKSANEPDYIVIDLDPDGMDEKDRPANTKNFKNVIKVALAAKKYFDAHELTAFVKTSGKTGMHFLIPVEGIAYGDSRIFAETICKEIHEIVRSISTINTSTNSRNGKVYIDASQNDYGDRLVAPYCVRAYKQPYVSTPLSWEEVNTKLNRHAFTIHTVKERLEQRGDLFEKLFDLKIQNKNTQILKQLIAAAN